MVLARSKQILDEPDDRALLNCLTLSFSNIMIAFLLFYAFCGCPGQIGPSLLQDDRPGTGVEPLEENMKWSDIVFSWFKGSSVDEVNNENTIIEDVGVEEKDEKSNSIRELLKSYLAPLVEGNKHSSYFALAEEIKDDSGKSNEIEGKVLLEK